MRVAWIHWGGAAFTAALTLLAGAPLNAADEGSVHYVAEELGNRTKAPEAEQAAPKGLSDSAVRVMFAPDSRNLGARWAAASSSLIRRRRPRFPGYQ